MKFLNTKIQKLIVTILIIGLIAPTMFLYKPREAKAGFFDEFAVIGTFIKETILDGLAYAIGSVIVARIGQDAVNFINSGFKMPDGTNSNFFSQPDVYLRKSIDEGIGKYLYRIVPSLCSPFNIDIETSLKMKYNENQNDFSECSLTGIGENFDVAFRNFRNDFDNGGWRRWVDYTVNPRNNPYGAYIEADARLGLKIGGIKATIEGDLAQGSGMLSLKETTCDLRAVKESDYFSGTPFPSYIPSEGRDYWINPETGEKIQPVLSSPFDAPCAEGEKTITTTPGKMLTNLLGKKLGTAADRLGMADEINEIVGALISQLIQLGFDKSGLSGARIDASEETSSLKRIQKLFKDFKTKLDKNIKKFIDIKKVTLKLTGNFDVYESTIQTNTEKTNIDWFGIDFDWTANEYYTEKLTKVDWDNAPYSWQRNEFLSKNNAGELYEVRCDIVDDEGSVSYSVTIENDKTLWAKAECEAIKDSNNEPTGESGWVLQKNGSGELLETYPAYVPTAGDRVSCDQNFKNKIGYVIKNVSDTFWSSSKCVKKSDNTFDWEKPSEVTPQKESFRKKERAFYEIKVDWTGFSFPWEEMGRKNEGVIYWEDKRKMLPNDGRTIGYDAKNGTRVENRESWAATSLNQNAGKGSRASLTAKGIISGEKACWPKGESPAIYVINDNENENPTDDVWEKYECKGVFNRQFDLKQFQTKTGFGDGEAARRLGLWEKTKTLKSPTLYLFISSEEATALLDNYGSSNVKNNFDEVESCLNTANKLDKKSLVNPFLKIDEKVAKRKEDRVQVLIDILYAKESMKNINEIEKSFSSFLSGRRVKELNYPNFNKMIATMNSSSGFSNKDITDALKIQNKIKAENLLLGFEWSPDCTLPSSDALTYADGYDLGANVGSYEIGVAEGNTEDAYNNKDDLPKGRASDSYSGDDKIKKSTLGSNDGTAYDGYLNGYYDAYVKGFTRGLENYKNSNPPADSGGDEGD